MTDRELLELAAKAAGIVGSWEVDAYSVQGREYFNVPYDNHNMLSGFEWNPLRDDSDAFRLAVKLRIDVHHSTTMVVAERDTAFDRFEVAVAELKGDDDFSATRRAIVRAAAGIGKAMP